MELATAHATRLTEARVNANVGNPAYTRFLIGDSINIPPNGNC